MADNPSKDVDAVRRVVEILQPLTSEQQRRVLAFVWHRWAHPPPAEQQPASPPETPAARA